MTIEILSERFRLRPLTIADVNERYLGWLSNEAARRFITSAATTAGLADLEQYVRERIDRDDVLFLGIFDRITGTHVGNIKYEPIDTTLGYAVMGILIGDPNARGKGVAPEVLVTSAEWLRGTRGIHQIILGVSEDNLGAVLAYKKAGFVIEPTSFMASSPGSLTMIRRS